MPQFFNVLPPDAALRALHDRGVSKVETERLPTPDAVGRVTGAAIVSPEDLPAFPRSAMDGYSVRAADTFGASESLPAYFDVVGEVAMGRPPEVSILDGQAAVAFTGGMLAGGADAVVMVEHTQQLDDSAIEVVRPVAPGENVVQPGEDARTGAAVLPSGHLLRPQDIGGLLALGIDEVTVSRRPVVSIVSTGDELVPPRTPPRTARRGTSTPPRSPRSWRTAAGPRMRSRWSGTTTRRSARLPRPVWQRATCWSSPPAARSAAAT